MCYIKISLRAFPGKKAWGGRNANELKFCGWGVSEELQFCRLWVSEEIEFCGWGAEMQVKLKCWGCNFDRFPSYNWFYNRKYYKIPDARVKKANLQGK